MIEPGDYSGQRPWIGSRWRHKDGGVYKVTGFRLQKDRTTRDWYCTVEYDHDDGNRNPTGLAYGFPLAEWDATFTQAGPGFKIPGLKNNTNG